MSLVLVATSLASWAPRFSYGFSSSTSLATVTPSLVMVGAPHFLSMTTLRPRGPSVTFTVSASLSTPRSRERRASSSNSRILGIDLPQPTVGSGAYLDLVAADAPRAARCGGPPGGTHGRWNYFSMIASTSRAESTRYSSPEYLTSVPPYLLYSTTSSTLTSTGTRAPLSSKRPGPTARTLPSWGFSFAVSGMTSPDAVTCSASSGETTIRSSSGLRTTLVAVDTSDLPLRNGNGKFDCEATRVSLPSRGSDLPRRISTLHQ